MLKAKLKCNVGVPYFFAQTARVPKFRTILFLTVLFLSLQISHGNNNQQKRKYGNHSSQHHQKQKNQQKTSHSDQNQNDAALVVCGVDGTVYTFDAWTGALRGLFASGPALVSSSTLNQEDEDENENDDYGDDNDLYDQMKHEEDDHDDSYSFQDDFDSDLDSQLNDPNRQKNNRKETTEENNRQHARDHTNGGKNQQNRQRRQHRNQSPRQKEQIVPGLDGNIYTLTHDDQYQAQNDNKKSVRLDKLPISVMDVINSPVSTCTQYEPQQTENHFGENFEKEEETNEECGIVMGEKKAKVFALDISTGSVRWMQHPSSSDMGFTSPLRRDSYGVDVGLGVGVGVTFSSKNKYHKKKQKSGLVLLQREDYIVRKIDSQSGEEWWNISIAHFSALDFSSPIQKEYHDEVISSSSYAYRKNQNTNKYTSFGRHRARGVASNPTPIGSTTQLELPRASSLERREMSGFTPIHTINQYFKDNDANNEKSDSSLESNVWPFPSIAFGEDGTSITAIDASTGDHLWKKSINSVVAAVYGVGRENRWISLDVVDEANIKEDQESSSDLQKITTNIKTHNDFMVGPEALAIVPYASFSKISSGQLITPRRSPTLSSNLPTGSILKKNKQMQSQSYQQEDKSIIRLARHLSTIFITSTTQNMAPFTNNPHFMLNGPQNVEEISVSKNDIPSQYPKILVKTKDGLFLTWRVVICLVSLIVGVIFGVRKAYLKEREELINTPLIASMKNDKSLKQPPPFLSLDGDQIPQNSSSTTASLARSMSLPHLNKVSSSGSDGTQQIIDRNLTSTKIGDINIIRAEKKFEVGGITIAEESNSLDVRNFGAPKEPKSDDNAREMDNDNPLSTVATSALNDLNTYSGVATIDGVPLVRYTRYASEFKEISSLGKGGFGTVFKCINALDSREYAIKKIRIKSYFDASGEPSKHLSAKLQRVLREVKILAVLDHANIVRYYTAWLETEKNGENEFCDEDEIAITSEHRDEMSRMNTSMSDSYNLSSRNGISASTQLHFSKQKDELNWSAQNKVNPLYLSGFENEAKSAENFCNNEENNYNALQNNSIDLGFTWERSMSNASLPLISHDESKHNSNYLDSVAKEYDNNNPSRNGLHCIDKSEGIESKDSTDSNDSTQSSESSDSEDDHSVGMKSLNEKYNTTNETSQIFKSDDKSSLNSKLDTCDQLQRTKKNKVRIQRHILYIQMQLCSQKTLADFLASPAARKNGEVSLSTCSECEDVESSIDITFAIRIFSQIVRGVKYVHSQGLIHRDLKPSNCFIDDTGVVKVGDFGLSRTAASYTEEDAEDLFVQKKRLSLGGEACNTAGIGTRSYASPEQMNGSDYDASTDVYSLGIILFELCYPMYTGMERHLVFEGIRKHNFPKQWHEGVAKSFPSLHSIINKMLSDIPSERPSADAVTQSIEALLSEYTVQSLDRLTSQRRKDSLLLRVEAVDAEGILPNTIKIIKEVSPQVKIVQYGLRGEQRKAIMEFAISFADDKKVGNKTTCALDPTFDADAVNRIFTALNANVDITSVRRVTEKHTIMGRSESTEISHEIVY